MNVRAALLVIAVVALTSFSVDARAGDAELKAAVEKAFEIGWKPSFKARAAVDAQYAAIKQISPADPRATYAASLIKVQQRQYPEAAKLLAAAVALDETNARAWTTKIWLSVLMKEHAAALLDMDKLSQLLADPSADAEAVAGGTVFLGLMIGYLEGPANNPALKTKVAGYHTKIAARLDDKNRVAFNKMRDEVKERFLSLTTTSGDLAEEAKIEAEAEKKNLIQDLATQRERMDLRRKELGPELDKLRAEAKSAFEKSAAEQRPLLEKLARIEARANAIRREALIYVTESERLRASAARTKDLNVQNSLLREVERVERLIRRYDFDLLALQRENNLALVGLNQIRAAAQREQAGFAAKIGQIDSELGSINKQQRRNDIEQKKTLRPTTGDTRRARALASQAAALKTYYEHSLDAEKQSVLDSF